MKTVIDQYGDTIISVIAVGLLLAFLFGVSGDGFLHVMADKGGEIENSFSDTWQSTVYEDIVSTAEPEVSLQNAGCLTDTEYNLTDLFLAKDEKGQEITVAIADIKTQDGASILYAADGSKLQETERFVFSKKGIYEVDVVITDTKNIVTKKTINIPVKRKW